jgi:hypothetical protein
MKREPELPTLPLVVFYECLFASRRIIKTIRAELRQATLNDSAEISFEILWGRGSELS